MKKKGKFKLMKNPRGGYKKHKGSSLTMNVPVVKRHSWTLIPVQPGTLYQNDFLECVRSLLNRSWKVVLWKKELY